MVRVQNEHVLVVINNALSIFREFANDMYKRSWCTWRIVPDLSKGYSFEELRFLFFDLQDLSECKDVNTIMKIKYVPFQAYDSLGQLYRSLHLFA